MSAAYVAVFYQLLVCLTFQRPWILCHCNEQLAFQSFFIDVWFVKTDSLVNYKEEARYLARWRFSRRNRQNKKGQQFRRSFNECTFPVLYNFPFVGIYACVDIHNISRFDPMQNHPNGISRLQKEHMSMILQDKTSKLDRMLTSTGSKKDLKAVETEILWTVNVLLAFVAKASFGYDFHRNFSNCDVPTA